MSLGGTSNTFKSDLPKIYNIVQNSMTVFPKEVIIASLREYFSRDSYYHYSKDKWGFANTPDHTGLLPDAGLHDDVTTRLFIGENYRQDVIFYPAILVKSGGGKYVPVSINREQGSFSYKDFVYDDGYGNQSTVRRPIAMITAGAWEGSITIDVLSRSLRARDDLVDLLAIFFAELNFDTFKDVGLIIKPPSISAAADREDRNDKLFSQSINLDIRTEWRREIPIDTLIDRIHFSIQFTESIENGSINPALEIDTDVSFTDLMLEI